MRLLVRFVLDSDPRLVVYQPEFPCYTHRTPDPGKHVVDGAGCGAAVDHNRTQPFDLPPAYLRPVERRRICDGLVSEDCDRAVEFPAHAAAPGRMEAVEINGGGILYWRGVARRDGLVRGLHSGSSRSSLPWRSSSSVTVLPRYKVVPAARAEATWLVHREKYPRHFKLWPLSPLIMS